MKQSKNISAIMFLFISIGLLVACRSDVSNVDGEEGFPVQVISGIIQ